MPRPDECEAERQDADRREKRLQDTQQRVVVFDLDGTLVRGYCFSQFVRLLLLRRPLRGAMSLVSAVVLVPLYLVPFTRDLGAAGFIWLATIGLSPERFDALARDFAFSHAAGPRRIATALDRLQSHIQAGDRVIVATGSADPVASAVCDVLGLTGVEVIAARLRYGGRAQRVAEGCLGIEKLRRIELAGVVTPVSYAYSDSWVDIPLLSSAVRPVLVGPSPRTVRRVRAALGSDPEILPLH
ncbi:MAG TPA: haloacid dehalogenase-like hydrolase [Trebonia sp.]|jgi:phosphatidylglycerophosphatase C